jgi:ribosomal protein L35
MKNAEGAKLRIKCTGSGCKVTQKLPGGKWATLEKTAGGSENYTALEAKYKSKGFK